MVWMESRLGGALNWWAAALIVSSGLVAVPCAHGQAAPDNRPAMDRPDDQPPPPPDGRNDQDTPPGLRRALERLNLPDEQQQRVNAIVEAYRQKQRQARADFLDQMKAILTADQYEHLEADMNRPPPGAGRGQAASNTAAPAATQPIVTLPDGSLRVPVTFTGGYETDPRDHGRPVVLIAAALGVTSDVFRDAFSHVTPASGGREPEPAQVNRNKQALLERLSPHGITNDRLDEVSNYYRYNGSRGEMWRHRPATAYAIVRNGVVSSISITDAGAGYSSAPSIAVQGVSGLRATTKLAFGTDFAKNGSIQEIKLETVATRAEQKGPERH